MTKQNIVYILPRQKLTTKTKLYRLTPCGHHLYQNQTPQRKEMRRDGGGLARVSWLWSLLAQQNDEQHGPISICLLHVCLRSTGVSTICHCRKLDRPHASKHFNTAQPTSNHLRGCDCIQEVDPDLCSPHVRHCTTMNEYMFWCLFTQRYVP